MNAMTRIQATIAISVVIALTPMRDVQAKEDHFKQVRVLLIAANIRCTTCHALPDGAGLNAYGKRLSDIGRDEPLSERIATLESDPPIDASDEQRRQILAAQDIDRDGIANWIEIVAQSSPADASDKADEKIVKKVQTAVSCNLCHTLTGGPGEGLDANPHNAFGKLLARTFVLPRRARKPAGDEAVREASERTPILKRIESIAKKKPKAARSNYWERILMLRSPADPADEPPPRELSAFRRDLARRRSQSKRDPDRGLGHKAHAVDGFLEDARGLLK
jgi:hypothetical protein